MEKLSDDVGKFVEGVYEKLHGLDVHEQNKVIHDLCTQVFVQRQKTYEKMEMDRNEYGKKLDEFIKGLQEISGSRSHPE